VKAGIKPTGEKEKRKRLFLVTTGKGRKLFFGGAKEGKGALNS